MRGYPLLQLLLVGCLFVAAGFPVWRLTHHARAAGPAAVPEVVDRNAPPSPSAAPSPAGDTTLEVKLSFAPAPTDFRLSYLGRTMLEGRGPQAEFQGTVQATLPKEGGDFALEAHWQGATTPAAARATFRFPDGHTSERSVWADAGGAMVELVTVTP